MLLAGLAMIAAATVGAADIRFVGACDGSAAVVVQAGAFVSANDETNKLTVYAFDGRVLRKPFDLDRFLVVDRGAESDIEGGAVASDGRYYWITSHGRNSKAKRKPERLRFFATRWAGDLKLAGVPRNDLLAALLDYDAIEQLGLAAASGKAPEASGGLNIEGLAAAPNGGVFIGFRNPLIPRNGALHALVVPLLNPGKLVDDPRQKPRFGSPVLLKLGGRGIRSIDRLSDRSYRILAGSPNDEKTAALFAWGGESDPVEIEADLRGLNPEALIELAPGRLMVLSDDGTDACKAVTPARQSFRGRLLP